MKNGVSALIAAVLSIVCASASAQVFPSRTVRMLVGYPSGGGMDGIARVLAQRLAEILEQQVVVENRPGAAGTLAADVVAKAPPDGHTICLAETGLLIAPSMIANMPIDPVRSFAPVALIGAQSLAFVVNPAFPAKNARELIAEIKAHPGKYSYASAGMGTVHHFAFEVFKRQTGVDAVHVPYKGGVPMIPDLVSGRIPIGVASIALIAPHVRSEKVRAIAITTLQRVPSVPDWPALADTLPGFDAAPRMFFLATANTPQIAIVKLNEVTNKVLSLKEVQENFLRQGTIPIPGTPEELGAHIASEIKRWSVIAREAGIKPE